MAASVPAPPVAPSPVAATKAIVARAAFSAPMHTSRAPGAFARARAQHAPEMTLLARGDEPAMTLFAQPRPLPLGPPAAAVPVAVAVGTFTADRRSAPGSSSAHRERNRPARHAEPAPTGVAGQRHSPFAPLDPGGPSSFAAVASGPSSGAAFVLWCALLVGLFICAARTLRRHASAPVVFTPTAFVSLLQRPG